MCALWEVIPDTKAQAGIGLRAEELGDILQPVVTSVTTLALKTERTEGQSEVVDDDQHALDGDLLRAHPVADSFAAEIHIGGGLEQDDLRALSTPHSDIAVALRLKAHTQTGSDGVGYTEADVVAGHIVFSPDIAEAYDEVFH